MSARAGWRIWGYIPVRKKGKLVVDDSKNPIVLAPPFSGRDNAQEFVKLLEAKGYVIAKIEWYSPPVRK